MNSTVIKIILTLLGLLSLIYCITAKIGGGGKFTLIILGTIFIFLGSFKKAK